MTIMNYMIIMNKVNIMNLVLVNIMNLVNIKNYINIMDYTNTNYISMNYMNLHGHHELQDHHAHGKDKDTTQNGLGHKRTQTRTGTELNTRK
jgi:hypothetical protein